MIKLLLSIAILMANGTYQEHKFTYNSVFPSESICEDVRTSDEIRDQVVGILEQAKSVEDASNVYFKLECLPE